MEPKRCKLLVAVDFSPPSTSALSWAFAYAQRMACQIHVVHVVDNGLGQLLPGRSHSIEEELEDVDREVRGALAHEVPAEARAAIGPVIQHIAFGHPAGEIVRIAEKLGVDLIVMGTHGHSGTAGLLVGSVAKRVVQEAGCPVVCVKANPAVTELAAVGGPM